jgi:hypothetical protein
MLDPQDQIEVLVKAIYSTVRKVHPADLSRSDGFLHQQCCRQCRMAICSTCSIVGNSNRSVDQLQAL